MRKILIFVMIFMMGAAPALAEPVPELASMSYEELIQLYVQVSDELNSRIRMAGTNRIGRGEYIVGKHIKPGTYDFICTETDVTDYGPKNYLTIYQLDDNGNPIGGSIWQSNHTKVGGHVTLILEEGTRLDIDGCSGELFEMTASWIP